MKIFSNRSRLVAGTLILVVLPLSACIQSFAHWEIKDVPRTASENFIQLPVKAHLTDGSVVIYSRGVRVTQNQLLGGGVRQDLKGGTSVVNAMAMDSVLGMESFNVKEDIAKSLLVSAAATGLAVVGSAAAMVAIFGSCPTYYVDSAGTNVLQGEGFSYSIAPLFEQRDVDRLPALKARDGTAIVEIRNEALETHYLNHLELVSIEHERGSTVISDTKHAPLLLKKTTRILAARDRAGRNISSEVAESDGVVYSTDERILAAANEKDLNDYIELEVDNPGAADSLVIHLRLRNSLLNTVLLYEGMLAGQGTNAFQWIEDTQRITRAIALGRWYSARMGMRILVERNGSFLSVARLNDKGPIAFDDVGIVIPTFGKKHARVRLQFPADNWRIDRIAAATFERPRAETVRLSSVMRDDGSPDAEAAMRLSQPDQQYLVTSPGQVFRAVFKTGPERPNVSRTYMLASQGYYTEWMRRDWIRPRADTKPFQFNDASLATAIASWRKQQAAFEQQFYSSSIPVR